MTSHAMTTHAKAEPRMTTDAKGEARAEANTHANTHANTLPEATADSSQSEADRSQSALLYQDRLRNASSEAASCGKTRLRGPRQDVTWRVG